MEKVVHPIVWREEVNQECVKILFKNWSLIIEIEMDEAWEFAIDKYLFKCDAF